MIIKLLFLNLFFLSQCYNFFSTSEVKDSNLNSKRDFILSKVKKIKKKFYDFEYSFVKKKDKEIILKITITSLKGFRLNGDGYPPFNIELKDICKDNNLGKNSDSKIVIKPKKISQKGIKEGESKTFFINIRNYEKEYLIEVYLKMIACDNSSCFIINDKILLEYNE